MKRMKYAETMVGITGELGENTNVKHVAWKIRAFFSLSANKGGCFKSETFYFLNKYWHIRIFPQGSEDASNGYCSLFLAQESPGQVTDMGCLLGFAEDDGQLRHKCSSIVFSSPSSGVHDYFSRTTLLEQKERYMPCDVLTVMCIMWQGQSRESCGLELVDLNSFSKNMEDLFTNDKDFDTTLIVKGKEFQAHRSLLAARSSVFAAMFEHDMTENATGIVNIPDCDEEAFGDFLRYLYSGRVLSLSLECALCLYFIAAKYEVQQLKMLCVQVMVKNLSLEKFTEVVLCAEQYGEIELFSAVQYFFNKNVKEIAVTEKWDTLLKDNPCLGNKLLIGMSEELPDDVIPELPGDEIPVELGMPEIIILQNDRIPIHVPDDGMSDEYSDDD